MSTILLPQYKFIEGDESIIKRTEDFGFSYRADYVNLRIHENIEEAEQRLVLTLDESYGLEGFVVISIDKSYRLKIMERRGIVYHCFS